MKHVIALHKAGYLTDQQVVVAFRFKKTPLEFKLAPTLFKVCFDLICNEIPFQEYEKQRGWAQRSAKVVLSQVLFALQEVQGMWWGSDNDLDNTTSYLLVETDQDVAMLVSRYSFTVQEARFFLVLTRNSERVVSRDSVLNALYLNAPSDSIPDGKILDTILFKIRQKIKLLGWTIETVRGVGFCARRNGKQLTSEDSHVTK